MSTIKLADGEYRFASIVWDHEPLSSGQLVELSAQSLGWKKSTTYTVLKKLVQRGILRNENAVVTSSVPREQILREESHAVVDRAFHGSLPAFIAAFMGGTTISAAEAEELKAIIDRYREEGDHA